MAIRIGGLASGMDTDTLVSDLMKAERIPLNKLTQKKQVLEWQRDDYRSMNTLLSDFDKYIFDNMTLQKDFLKKTVTSSMSDAVTATANSSSANVSTSLNVTQLATSANWISGTSSYTAPIANTEIEMQVTNGDGTVKDVKMTIKAGATLDEVLKQFSNNKDLGVTAFSESGKVVMTKNDTGSKASIKLMDADAEALFTSLGFTFDGGTKNLNVTNSGKDATFEINGLATSRSSNTFTINNVNYTLNDVTNGKTAKISVGNDTDSMVDKIVQFVNKYNEMIEKINGEISETRYRDYQPLSNEEKEAMSEKQVELWEEKAKSGLLKNDSILSGTLTKMRTALYTPYTGTGSNSDYNQLAQIGITTSSNYRENGKLSIDETKLRAAIDKDPNAVFQLFSGATKVTTTAADGTTTTKNSSVTSELGITNRLRSILSDTVKSIEKKAGKATSTNQQFLIGRNIVDLDSQIVRFESRLVQTENRYWRQFTAMEKAIQQANSQSTYLMQQFG
ncbi:flagellar hook-associated protein 2 [Metabacillus halosaccharovorans]|uniref:flagellar hook-associated protein 2 n=1 Tax=Metabacillus halosaccharovorans TaxID=930124 RepID=UPI001C1FA123|nr:flagellar hook-associated protein 2 [Metabacillus halosaccharovorans]MBU7594573.1 flagellar hook-associated protein 2 [Metabacillus halosaccharovorans]